MKIPCHFKSECPETIPLLGFSSETPDSNPYWATGYARPPQPLGESWGEFGAVATADGFESQTDTQFLADQAAMALAENPPPADAPKFPDPIGPTWGAILAEDGEPLLTEDGEMLILE